jgi:hypothetical protein
VAFVIADRVKESTTTTGTGTLTLGGAGVGYQTFSAGIGANNTTFYAIASGSSSEWEVGIGTVGAGGTTLTRDSVIASSNAGAAVNFSAGTKDVFCDYPAKRAVFEYQGCIQTGNSGAIYTNPTTISADATIDTNYNGMSAGPITVNSGVTVTIPSGSVWTVV